MFCSADNVFFCRKTQNYNLDDRTNVKQVALLQKFDRFSVQHKISKRKDLSLVPARTIPTHKYIWKLTQTHSHTHTLTHPLKHIHSHPHTLTHTPTHTHTVLDTRTQNFSFSHCSLDKFDHLKSVETLKVRDKLTLHLWTPINRF